MSETISKRTYNDCISEDCENTDNGAVDLYGDGCSSWYDANESPGSAGCTGMYDLQSPLEEAF